MRSHYCGQVNENHTDQTLEVSGWVHRRRDHGGVIFIDLRDREGLLQVVFHPDAAEIFALAERVRGEIEVYFGGPVDPGRGFLLHSTDVLLKDSVVVDNKVALTAQPDMLRAIARGEGPAQSIFTLGYSGWGPGQLESELARDTWFVTPADMSLVFAANPTKSWERAAARRSLDL